MPREKLAQGIQESPVLVLLEWLFFHRLCSIQASDGPGTYYGKGD